MKIIFFGTPELTKSTLEALHQDPEIEISAVFTQPDKPVGRKKILSPTPIKVLAQELKLTVLQPKTKEELNQLTNEYHVDFYVVFAYGMIFKQETLQKPSIAPINIHTSLLPEYRGASPIQSALLDGKKITGISIMKMDAKMDHGPIYKQIQIPISATDDLETLNQKMSDATASNICSILKDIYKNKLSPQEQVHKKATYCKKISKQDGEIDWNKSTTEIHNMIKAYKIWPGTFTYLDNKKVKIISGKKSELQAEKGTFHQGDGQIFIGTKDGSIEVTELQMEGKKTMNAKEFINGYSQYLEKL